MFYTKMNFPLGALTALSDGKAVCGLWIDGQKHYGNKELEKAERNDGIEVFAKLAVWLTDYFAGKNPQIDFDIELNGTAFQKRVWNELKKIEYGKKIFYSDIARAIDQKSSRAIGAAVGRNPVSILIPCHRVIGKNGALTGYAGGVDKKETLLQLEKDTFCDRKA